MRSTGKGGGVAALTAMVLFCWISGPAAAAAVRIEGQVQAGGAPLARSTVTLWAGVRMHQRDWRKPRPGLMVDT